MISRARARAQRATMSGRPEVAYLSTGEHAAANGDVNRVDRLWNGVKRVDFHGGKTQVFDFGADVVAGEPVFAARRGGGHNEGWLIVQCVDGRRERAFFAIFDASHLDAGPIAPLHLPHRLPISFHGWWKED